MSVAKIAILCRYPFPVGLAATNRIIAYSKGIVANRGEVTVFAANPTDRPGMASGDDRGFFDGVEFVYPIGRVRKPGKIAHLAEMIRGIGGAMKMIAERHRNTPFDALIISDDNPVLLWYCTRFAARIGLQSFFIFDEYPPAVRNGGSGVMPGWLRMIYDIALKHVTGMISIVPQLLEVYNSNLHKKALIFPSITDISRFSVERSAEAEAYLCYMGGLDLSKDSVDLLVRAFARIAPKYPDLKFYIYGNDRGRDADLLRGIITDDKLERRVLLKGKVPGSEVPEILMNARVLVSAQKNSIRIIGGLPTKLGEYLASGVPMLLSDVGNIREHAVSGVHLYLAPPDDQEAYAAALARILDDYPAAQQVAACGRAYLFENFSHITMGKKLLFFIKGEQE